jgi:hypothetical protein
MAGWHYLTSVDHLCMQRQGTTRGWQLIATRVDPAIDAVPRPLAVVMDNAASHSRFADHGGACAQGHFPPPGGERPPPHPNPTRSHRNVACDVGTTTCGFNVMSIHVHPTQASQLYAHPTPTDHQGSNRKPPSPNPAGGWAAAPQARPSPPPQPVQARPFPPPLLLPPHPRPSQGAGPPAWPAPRQRRLHRARRRRRRRRRRRPQGRVGSR